MRSPRRSPTDKSPTSAHTSQNNHKKKKKKTRFKQMDGLSVTVARGAMDARSCFFAHRCVLACLTVGVDRTHFPALHVLYVAGAASQISPVASLTSGVAQPVLHARVWGGRTVHCWLQPSALRPQNSRP
jgi:hypothetical protein